VVTVFAWIEPLSNAAFRALPGFTSGVFFSFRFPPENQRSGHHVCVVIAAAATFLSEHYGGPQVLFGLLIGLAISSVLPQTKENERFTLLAVVGVAVLSALSMIF